MAKPDLQDRLWARVSFGDGCWEWQGYRNPGGYGRLQRVRGRMELAHRVAWESANGPIPDGFLILHRCDNPPCCNPAHLFLGDHKANSDDKIRKGRERWKGPKRAATAKLTEEQVREIRAAGLPHADLARRYGISVGQISKIVRGIQWKAVA